MSQFSDGGVSIPIPPRYVVEILDIPVVPHKEVAEVSTRRRMARERRGAESSVVSMETRFLHTGSFTQTLLHTDAFTHRRFLHTDAFYTQTL